LTQNFFMTFEINCMLAYRTNYVTDGKVFSWAVSKYSAVEEILYHYESPPPSQVILSEPAQSNSVTRDLSPKCSVYEGRLKSSWTGGSAPLLRRGRRWLLCQVVVVGVT
jgi:hypothetical protein